MTQLADHRSALPHLLDVDGLAEHLAVSVRHVRRLVAEKRIPFIKWGRYIRFDPAEVAEWVVDARVPTRDEVHHARGSASDYRHSATLPETA